MVVIKKKGTASAVKWKPLQLNESMLANGIEGLIGIEELTDYTLVQKKRTYKDYEEEPEPQIKVVRVRARKTELPASLIEHAMTWESSLPVAEPSVPAVKKKKKSLPGVEPGIPAVKKKNKLTLPVVEPVAALPAVKKKKKRNPNRNKKNKNKLPVDSSVAKEVDQLTAADDNSTEVSTEVVLEKKTLKAKNKKKAKRTDSADVNQQQAMGQSVETKSRKRNAVESASSAFPSKKKKKALNEKVMKKATSSERNDTKIEHNEVKLKDSKKKSVDRIKAFKKDKIKKKRSLAKKKIVPQEKVIDNKMSKPVEGMEGWAGLNLPDSILRALSEKGFKEPTEIQARSLPAAVLGRRDIMGAAETGSGKTLAFGIPIIYGILQQKRNAASHSVGGSEEAGDEVPTDAMDPTAAVEPAAAESDHVDSDDDGGEEVGVDADGIGCVRVVDNVVFDDDDEEVDVVKPEKPVNPAYNQKLYALVLTPTRELAIQVKDHLEVAAKYTGIRVAVVVGGLAHQKQERLLKTKPEIVVATPGRLWELIQEGNPYLQQVNDISYLAIDETDRMIEKGHFQELRELLERINLDTAKSRRRQNFVFSATLTMVHEPPRRKSGKQQMRVTPGQKLADVIKMLGITQPKVVDVTQQSGTAKTLREAQIRCTFDEKDIFLYYFLISHPGRTLIFCNSISCVRRLAQLLTILRCKPLPIHANMVQKQRLRNLDKFIANPTSLLLATDVAARGLDIPDVQHVVHYQVPRTSEGYVHRSGRTARASKDGLTLLLVEPEENQAYTRLCRTLGRDQELPAYEVSQDLFTAAKQRVKLARDIDQLELTSRRSDAELGWFQKALTDMDMVLDKDDLPMRISEEDTVGNRRMANEKRKQLESLLSRPVFSTRK